MKSIGSILRCHSILNQVKALKGKKNSISMNKESIRNSVSYQNLTNKIQYANDEQQLFKLFEQNNHLYKIGHLTQSLRMVSRFIKTNVNRNQSQNYRFNIASEKKLQDLFARTIKELQNANEVQLLDVLFFVRNYKHNIQDRIWLKKKMVTSKEVDKLAGLINGYIEQNKYNLNNLSDICFGLCVMKLDISTTVESILNIIKQDVRQITPYMMFSILKVYSLRNDQEMTTVDIELLEIVIKQYLLNLEYLELTDVIDIYLNLLQISCRNMQKVTNRKTIRNSIDMSKHHLLQNIEQFQKQQIIRLIHGYREMNDDGPDELIQQIQDMVDATLTHNNQSMDLDFTINYLYDIINLPKNYRNYEKSIQTLESIKKVIQQEFQLKSLSNQMMFSIAAYFKDTELLNSLYQKIKHESIPINQTMILIRFNIDISELKFNDQQVVYKYMVICYKNMYLDGQQQEEEQQLKKQIIDSIQDLDGSSRKMAISIFNQFKNVFDYTHNHHQYRLIDGLVADVMHTLFQKQHSHQVLYFLSRYVINFVNYYSYELIQPLMLENLEKINQNYCEMIMKKNNISEQKNLKNNFVDNLTTSLISNIQNQNQKSAANIRQVQLILQIVQKISPKYYFQFVKLIKKVLRWHMGQNKECILHILKFMDLCLDREQDTQQVAKDITEIILLLKMNKTIDKYMLFESFDQTFLQYIPIFKSMLVRIKQFDIQMIFKNEVVFRLALHYKTVSNQECLDLLRTNNQLSEFNHLVSSIYYDYQIYSQNQEIIDQLCQKNVDDALKQLAQTNSKQIVDSLVRLMHYETKFFKKHHEFVLFQLKNTLSSKDIKEYLISDLIKLMPDELSETQVQYQQEILNIVIQSKNLLNSDQIVVELQLLHHLKLKYLNNESVYKLSLKMIRNFSYIKYKLVKLQYAYTMINKNILEQNQIEQVLNQLFEEKTLKQLLEVNKDNQNQSSSLFHLSQCLYLANNQYQKFTDILVGCKMMGKEIKGQPFQISPACYLVLVQPDDQETLLNKYLQEIDLEIYQDYHQLMQLHYLSLYLEIMYPKIYSGFQKKTDKYSGLIDEQLKLEKDKIRFQSVEKYLKLADIEFKIKKYSGIEYISVDNQNTIIKPCLEKHYNRNSQNLRGLYQLQVQVLKALYPQHRMVTLNIQEFNGKDISQNSEQWKLNQLIKLGISFKNDRINIE